nr:HipA domain-containing protein [Candidatus Microthrix sp.]
MGRWSPTRISLLEQVVVNMVVGNADLHGKNLSLLHREGVVSLAPCYDVMSTTALSEDVDRPRALSLVTPPTSTR